jgi:hypothetical protein
MSHRGVEMIEWEHLALYCQSDPDFFAPPGRLPDSAELLDAAVRDAPEGWSRRESELWVRLTPPAGVGPDTGWKIHVSVTLDAADRVCNLVWDYCVSRPMPFKFLRSRRAIQLMNGKYADRAGSGKTIAIYPPDDGAFADAVHCIGTDGEPVLADEADAGRGSPFQPSSASGRLAPLANPGDPDDLRTVPSAPGVGTPDQGS